MRFVGGVSGGSGFKLMVFGDVGDVEVGLGPVESAFVEVLFPVKCFDVRGVVVFWRIFYVFDLGPGVLVVRFAVRSRVLTDSARTQSPIHFFPRA